MESTNVIQKLKNYIKQLKLMNTNNKDSPEETSPEKEQKKTSLIKKIVDCFDEILSDNFKLEEQPSPDSKENKNHYWTFISKYFNSSLVLFCIINDKNAFIKFGQNENLRQKGENWIFLGILEKSFSDSIKEIYKQGWDKIYYDKNSILNKYKNDIISILNELKLINFNIKNKDYEKYLEFISKNSFYVDKDMSNFYSQIPESPIINNTPTQLIFNELNLMPTLKTIDISYPNEHRILDSSYMSNIKEDFFCERNTEYYPKLNNNFYSFVPNLDLVNTKSDDDDFKLDNRNISNININYSYDNLNIFIKNSDFNFNKFNISSQGLILNPKNSTFLPTDNLYEIIEKSSNKEFTKNDKINYNKKQRPISNCLLFYLNNYYKKALFHKFYKHNLHNRPISLKEQNYQCYICYKKFSINFGIPTERIFWCSYYMRFICKNCIDEEYSIIPYFVLEKWCFEKFPISKKAKMILLEWYDKPIVYFKKYDKLLKKITTLNKVIEIKKVINNILDIMKCENKFNFIKDNLGEYEHIALKEYLFSMRDLVEINQKSFIKKMKIFKNKFVKHISGECSKCKFEGEICEKCRNSKKIFFYDTDNVFFCKICRKSFHKRCIGLVGHIH